MEHYGDFPNILIVDDIPANLELLSDLLEAKGFHTRPAANGKMALQAAESEKPDLVLLDINMPEMNGYEVCERFKASDTLKDVPIIFVSAFNETIDKVKAFSLGAVDYVTKPFQIAEVVARVSTHLKIRSLQLEIEEKNHQLEEKVRVLVELEKVRDNLTHAMVHDLRSPLAAILSNLQFVLKEGLANALSEDNKKALDDAYESSQQLAAMVTTIIDVSSMEAKALPIELKEKNRELEEKIRIMVELEKVRDNLTHMLVHDLRSPLTAILSNLQFVLKDGLVNAMSEDNKEALGDAYESSQQLAEMVTTILDVSCMEAKAMHLKKECVDILDLTRSATKLLKGLSVEKRISIEPQSDNMFVYCDPVIIRRVIANLLGNALKFTDVSKPVKVKIENEADEKIRVSVIDQGEGIPSEYQSKIFDKFVRLESKEAKRVPSTGLGLTFCKLAVNTHGGTIGVESEIGKGSAFWFMLPKSAPNMGSGSMIKTC